MRKLTALLVVALLASTAAAYDLPVWGNYSFEETTVGEGSMMHPDGKPGYQCVIENTSEYTFSALEFRFSGDFWQWEDGDAWYQTYGADTMFDFSSGDLTIPPGVTIDTEEVLQSAFAISDTDQRIGPNETAVVAYFVTESVPTAESFGTGAEDYPVAAIPDGFEGYLIPEPATMSLLALGGVAALIRRKR